MWDWERASVPYQPIRRRRLWRKRLVAALVLALIVLPYAAYRHHVASQSIGERVYDQVVSTVAMRYYDAGYHGIAWRALAQRYRAPIVTAPSTAKRYAALRAMLAQLRDSHTAVYSPDELQPPRDARRQAGPFGGRRGAVFGMAPAALRDDGPAVDWRTLAPGIGYLRLGSFPDSLAGLFSWAMSDVARDRALVLDLRGNPGGLVDSVDAVAGAFLPEGTLISTGTRRFHIFGPQRFTATRDTCVTYSSRLVVLVDATTRSGAESLARALQYYHRATLVGAKTAGQVLGVDVEIALADGGLLRVATLDMRAPDGQRLEGRGVTPDILVTDPRRQVGAALKLLANEPQSR